MAQPGLGAVTLMQERQARADREALVAHRGENEHLVERQRLGEQPVEPHVGEQAAGHGEPARAGALKPVAHRLHGEIFRHFLDRGSDRFAIMALAEAEKLLAHRGPVAEIRLVQARLFIEAELRRHFGGELRLAVGGQAGELSLMAQHAKTARNRRVAVGTGEACFLQRLREPAVIAVVALERAIFQAAHRVADIVANAVRRVDQRLVPVGVEQRSERMRRMMIGEIDLRLGPERIVFQKAIGAEQPVRIRDAEAMREHREFAVGALAAAPAVECVMQLAPEWETIIVRRKPAARGRDRIDIVAPPARDRHEFQLRTDFLLGVQQSGQFAQRQAVPQRNGCAADEFKFS